MNKKKILIFLVSIATITSLLFYAEATFSKYKKKVDTKISTNLARWNIKVNDESILNKTTLTNTITPVFTGDANTAASVIAPGSVGYFDLAIDSSEVDVSFSYNIKVYVNEESSVVDMIATGYQIEPSTNPPITTYDGTNGIDGNIVHNFGTTNIRVHVKWDDDASASMDNQADTAAVSTENSQAIMTVNILFKQTQ